MLSDESYSGDCASARLSGPFQKGRDVPDRGRVTGSERKSMEVQLEFTKMGAHRPSSSESEQDRIMRLAEMMQICLREADLLNLSMVGVYLSSAIGQLNCPHHGAERQAEE